MIARIALEHNPIESSLYFNYANALGKMGRYEESERNFLLAIKYQEHAANYHSNLGSYFIVTIIIMINYILLLLL